MIWEPGLIVRAVVVSLKNPRKNSDGDSGGMIEGSLAASIDFPAGRADHQQVSYSTKKAM
jgi:hypothetical protein